MMRPQLRTSSGIVFEVEQVGLYDGVIRLHSRATATRDYTEDEHWFAVTLYGSDESVIGIFPDSPGVIPAGTEAGSTLEYRYDVTLD